MEHLSVENIMEEKEELMVPFNGGLPTLRRAHFLKPTVDLTEPVPSFPVSAKTIPQLEEEGQYQVEFKSRRCPHKRWKEWVDMLQPEFQHIWRKAGIFEAIMASTYTILRDNDLLIELAEKWCEVTNTFIFPWGEVSVTLEDMVVLGGYSVLGESILTSVNRDDFLEKRKGLNMAHEDIRIKSKNNIASDNDWIDCFMGSKNTLEHEAFLSLWLSTCVFPMAYTNVGKHVFSLAVHLSMGTQIALAPAVLASIYRDLSLLKNSMVTNRDKLITVWAPFQLVQLWAWERFPSLGPTPNALKCGEPRAARWHRLTKAKVNDVTKGSAFSGDNFQWRPYTTVLKNWDYSKFYWDNQDYVLVQADVDVKVDSFARWLRGSELVGMDCVECYLPHRVAMQFGFDQDVPGYVCMSNECPKIAWDNYARPITYSGFYVPPRLLEADVTTRYIEWWNEMSQGVLVNEFVAKVDRVEVGDFIEGSVDEEDELIIGEAMRRRKMRLNVDNDVVVGDVAFSGPECSSSCTVLGRCDKRRESSNVAQEENVQRSKDKLEEGNVGLATRRVCGIELEDRVENIERILALIEAGKLVPGAGKWSRRTLDLLECCVVLF